MPDAKATKAGDGRFRRPLLQGALAVATTAAMASPAPALAEAYLKLGDIKGESTDAKHKDYIDILSFTQSFTNPLEQGGGGAGQGRVQCGAITMMKNIDKSSPLLLKGVATGQHFKDGIIAFQAPTASGARASSDYYTINLTDVFVTELTQTDAQDPNRIFEKLVLNAVSYEFKYMVVNSKGVSEPIAFKYNCAENSTL